MAGIAIGEIVAQAEWTPLPARREKEMRIEVLGEKVVQRPIDRTPVTIDHAKAAAVALVTASLSILSFIKTLLSIVNKKLP